MLIPSVLFDLVEVRIDHLKRRILDVTHEISDDITNMPVDLAEELHGSSSYLRVGIGGGELCKINDFLKR